MLCLGEPGAHVEAELAEGRASEWLLALAGSVSEDLRRKAARAYAGRLASDGDHVKAASYHLLAGDYKAAVRELETGRAFRLAVALTK